MKRLLNALQPADRSHKFFTRGTSILVALSGGPDSLCLVLVLRALSASRGIRLAAAHVNHGLRPEAGRDEAWVRRWCAREGIEFFAVNAAAKLKARAKTESIEEAARRVRYAALVDLAVRHKFDQLATAHTADDQAETVLMRLGTGSGFWGLAGIPVERTDRGVRIIRPLLQIPKSELIAVLRRKKIPFLTDKTNKSDKYLRNRVRSRLLPELRKWLNARTDEHLADLAADAATWRSWSEAWSQTFIKKHAVQKGVEIQLSVKALKSCPEPLRPSVYFTLARTLTGKDQNLRREHIRQLDELLMSGVAGERRFLSNIRVRQFSVSSGFRIGWRVFSTPS